MLFVRRYNSSLESLTLLLHDDFKSSRLKWEKYIYRFNLSQKTWQKKYNILLLSSEARLEPNQIQDGTFRRK